MKALANIFHLGVKELRSLWFDKVLFVFVVWAFSGGIYAVATSASVGLHNAPIAVVDEDRTPLSQQIADAFYGPYFLPVERISLNAMDRNLDTGRYTFIIDIPPGFQRDLLAGRQPALQVNIDATRMTQAFIGQGYIRNIVAGEIGRFVQGRRDGARLPIELATRVKFNPNLEGLWFGGVMEIINNVTMLSIILAGAALIREREHGTLEHLLVMPLSPLEIMAAKVWANALVVLVAAWLSLVIVVQGALDVPIAGSIPLFLLGAALHLFSTTAIGIYLGTVARSMPQFGLLMILVIVPLQMLSGSVTPPESMPEGVQWIMQAAPTTHFVGLAQAILYRGAGWATVWPQFLAVIAIGTVFFAAAHRRFRASVALT